MLATIFGDEERYLLHTKASVFLLLRQWIIVSHRPSSYTAAFITGRGEARGVWNKWAAGFYIKGPASTRFSHAFGRYLLQSGLAAEGDPILIGQDLRNSSPQIALNCTKTFFRTSPTTKIAIRLNKLRKTPLFSPKTY